MAEVSYSSSSLGWQARQAYRNISEWFEYQFSRLDFDPPEVPRWSWPTAWGRGLFWVLVVVLGLWLSWLLYTAIATYLSRRQPHRPSLGPPQTPEQERTAAEWWREANRLAQQGNYRQGCRALYMAALQRLHDSRWIPHSPSRTDGEYLTAVSQVPHQRPYQLLIRTHERLEFGDTLASAETFDRCQIAYRELEKS